MVGRWARLGRALGRCVFALVAPVLQLLAPTSASSADWIVTSPETHEDQTITLQGNLVIENGGRLVLRRTLLTLDNATHGQYGIRVKSGGTIVIEESSVVTTTSTDARMFFVVEADAAIEMRGSELRRCGHADPSGWGVGNGLVIEGSAVLEDSTFAEFDQVSLTSPGTAGTIVGSTFRCDGQSEGELFVLYRSGLTITGNTFGPNRWFGISLYESHSNAIRDNHFDHVSHGPMVLQRSWNNEFSHNTVVGRSGPWILQESGNTLVTDNTFDVENGVTVLWSDNTTIMRNTFSGGATHWVCLAYASHGVIADNTFGDVSALFAENVAGILLQHASDNTIANNRMGSLRFGDQARVGILLWGSSSGNRIVANEIGPARRGISIHYASNDNTLVHNTFHPATEQPVVVELSNGNRFHHNNFLGGARKPFDDTGTNQWDDGGAGNYWADAAGTWPAPYPVPPAGADLHPLLASVPPRHEPFPPNPPLPIQFRDAPLLDISTEFEISDQTVGPYRWVDIKPGGRLTLRNATLLVVGGEHGIIVQGGGTLEAYDSRIVPPSPELGGFIFWVHPGGALVLKRSELRGVGVLSGCGDWSSLYIEASGAVIEDSTITDSSCAFNAEAGGGHRVERNTIGLCLNCSNGASTSVLVGNRVDRCLNRGLEGGDGVEIRGNSVSHVWGRAIVTNQDSVVIGNSMTDSESGLQVSTGSTIRDNVITGMFGWAFVNYCPGCLVTGNTFADSGGGVQAYGLSSHCGNNFIRNVLQAQAVGGSNHWDCGGRGNYWSDYQGVDPDGDGIGDTPYLIDGGERDNFPLIDTVRRPPRRHLTRGP